MEQLTLQQGFYGFKLTYVNQNPDEWICKLNKLRKKLNNVFKTKISERDLMIQMLNNMPSVYDTTTELLTTALSADEDKEDILEGARLMINAHYKKIMKTKKEKQDDVKEMVLATASVNINPTNRKCCMCGKLGHLAANCFKDPKNCDKYEEWKKSWFGNNYHRNPSTNHRGQSFCNNNYSRTL